MNTKKPTNIIWIFADQMRGQAFGHAGDPNARTPNIDRLALEGIYFPQAISGTPLCCPQRGSLITSRYPHHSSVPGHNHSLDPNMRTIGHEFKDAGYKTCWIGKWHIDGNQPQDQGVDPFIAENNKRTRIVPPERRAGFDDWWAYEINNRPYDCWIHTSSEEGKPAYKLPGYATDSLTDITIDWMKKQVNEHSEQPFFCTVSLEPPHNPYIAPAQFMEKYRDSDLKLRPNVPQVPAVMNRVNKELAGYYAAIENLDWNVGRIRDAIQELDISENTYIVFFSDHGDMHGSQGQFHKTSPWEESIRVPFIVSGPSREHQNYYFGGELDAVINHVDIAPTTLGLCGLKKPAYMEGFDYSELILNQYDPSLAIKFKKIEGLPDSAYISLPLPTMHPDSIDRQFRGIVTKDRWKYIALENQPWLMFNLNDDPYEQVNLAHNTKYHAKRKILNDILKQWIIKTEDLFPLPDL